MNSGLRSDIIRGVFTLLLIGSGVVILFVISKQSPDVDLEERSQPTVAPQSAGARGSGPPSARRQEFGRFSLWWDGIPEHFHQNRVDTGDLSNIHASDYAGPESCRQCHEKNYEAWSKHPHRWMNALAGDETVKGDFSGADEIEYLGGKATFRREGDKYLVELNRGNVHRLTEITQTIGSRFYQYYIGIQLEGPEPPDHPRYSEDHVLPFGYWIDRGEWVPIVHVHDREDLQKEATEVLHDPFAFHESPTWDDWDSYCDNSRDLYRAQCNFCHTTFPVGDMMIRSQQRFGRYAPVDLHLSMPDYVAQASPELWDTSRRPTDMSDAEFAKILRTYHRLDAREHAVTLGVSCEACHLGAKEHAENKDIKPAFFPASPDVVTQTADGQLDLGRTHANMNWACGRCHAGTRPEFTSGINTWNSTEYSDAMKGSCYSKLACVDCHNPHESIGHQWSRTPAEDDASCLKCHAEFEPADARMAHTHHPLDSEGSRCMNCHMPRINEGLQDIVRTHTIFSPTQRSMIENNEPNACNVCHVDQSVDWTVAHLKDWYDVTFDDAELTRNYPDRDAPATVGWLQSGSRFVRQIGIDALTRAKANWALPEILTGLDDPYLLNRQFARIGLEDMLDIQLSDFGYHFYMMEEERQTPLQRLRDALIPRTAATTATPADQ